VEKTGNGQKNSLIRQLISLKVQVPKSGWSGAKGLRIHKNTAISVPPLVSDNIYYANLIVEIGEVGCLTTDIGQFGAISPNVRVYVV